MLRSLLARPSATLRPSVVARPRFQQPHAALIRSTSSTSSNPDLQRQPPAMSSDAAPAPPPADLDDQILALGNKIRQLKLDKQPIANELAQLTALKALKPKVDKPAPAAAADGGKKGDKKPSSRLILKVPKGTKDFLPQETTVRRRIFSTLETVFQNHGAATIDTPVFELKDILAGKYGEDSKLIYDLQDQGGELCSLRYDLTVPFARFLAMNGLTSLKRYHIAKVYRRDQPAISKGRLREFYQCDFDIAGQYDAMVPDAEVLAILCEALDKLDIGDYTVKINHRKILDGVFAICGVPEDKTRAISSAVDKLDKAPWEDVKREMTDEKSLDPAVADRIGEYVKLKGDGFGLLAKLEQDATLAGHALAGEGLKDMKLLFEFLDVYGCLGKMSFDLSLARGLDYYTGIIYEAVTEYSAPPAPQLAAAGQPPAPKTTPEGEVDETTVGVGSIAAGGRYDNLVGMFASAASGAEGKKKQKEMERGRVPCVGVSVGVERVYAIMMARQAERERATGKTARGKETKVYVVSVGDGLLKERMQIAKELWDAGIPAEFMYKNKPKNIKLQFDVVDKESIPFAVIVGADEISSGRVRIKDQTRTKEELLAAEQAGGDEGEGASPNGLLVERTEMVGWIQKRLEVVGDEW